VPPRSKLNGIDLRVSPRTRNITYRVRWRDPDTHKQLAHSFTDRREAIEAKRSIELAGNRCFCPHHCPPDAEPSEHYGAGSHRNTITWGTYARRHIRNRPGIGEHYRAQFERDLDLHLKPLLDLEFLQLNRDRVAEWIRGLEVAGLSATTIRRLTVQASSVQRAAIDAGLANTNPFTRHRTGRRDRDVRTQMHCLSHSEWAVLAATLPAGVYRDLATVLVGTGMRFGEATALRVSNVELDADPPRLHVAEAWKSNGANGWVLGPPKSARSRRIITFGTVVAEALARRTDGKAADELVFATAAEGAPIRNSNFSARVWRPAVQAAGLTGLRIHDLRHTYCSWLLAAGVPVLEVSRRLGHESMQTTSTIYAHVMPSTDAANASVLDDAMSPSPPEDPPDPSEG
jgi:integrase